MLKELLSTWDKKGERYAFANVSLDLEKKMLAVLPTKINIIRYHSDSNAGEIEEAHLGEGAALIGVTANEKNN